MGSELWNDNPKIAEECGHEKADDGLFWMSFEDFCRHYSSISVCKKSMKPNRGKATHANVRALNAAPQSDVVRHKRVSIAMKKKRVELARHGRKRGRQNQARWLRCSCARR